MTTNHARAPRPSAETETTEVQPRRSGWTATEKLAILTEYEPYPHGDPRRGALLRRIGAYTSHISKWRKQRARGALAHLAPRAPGPKPQQPDPLQDEVAQLRRELARLQARLEQAEAVIEIQKSCAAAWRARPSLAQRRCMMLEGVSQLAPTVGVARACEALGVPRSSFYHAQQPPTARAAIRPHPPSPRALSAAECAQIRELLNSERFVDRAPRTVYAILLDICPKGLDTFRLRFYRGP